MRLKTVLMVFAFLLLGLPIIVAIMAWTFGAVIFAGVAWQLSNGGPKFATNANWNVVNVGAGEMVTPRAYETMVKFNDFLPTRYVRVTALLHRSELGLAGIDGNTPGNRANAASLAVPVLARAECRHAEHYCQFGLRGRAIERPEYWQ